MEDNRYTIQMVTIFMTIPMGVPHSHGSPCWRLPALYTLSWTTFYPFLYSGIPLRPDACCSFICPIIQFSFGFIYPASMLACPLSVGSSSVRLVRWPFVHTRECILSVRTTQRPLHKQTNPLPSPWPVRHITFHARRTPSVTAARAGVHAMGQCGLRGA